MKPMSRLSGGIVRFIAGCGELRCMRESPRATSHCARIRNCRCCCKLEKGIGRGSEMAETAPRGDFRGDIASNARARPDPDRGGRAALMSVDVGFFPCLQCMRIRENRAKARSRWRSSGIPGNPPRRASRRLCHEHSVAAADPVCPYPRDTGFFLPEFCRCHQRAAFSRFNRREGRRSAGTVCPHVQSLIPKRKTASKR